MTLWTLLVTIIPSLISGIILWRVKVFGDKLSKKHEEDNKVKAESNLLIFKGLSASLALGEATAEALKTGKCNGNLEKACTYATDAKHEIKDFMYKLGSKQI